MAWLGFAADLMFEKKNCPETVLARVFRVLIRNGHHRPGALRPPDPPLVAKNATAPNTDIANDTLLFFQVFFFN